MNTRTVPALAGVVLGVILLSVPVSTHAYEVVRNVGQKPALVNNDPEVPDAKMPAKMLAGRTARVTEVTRPTEAIRPERRPMRDVSSLRHVMHILRILRLGGMLR
jgi:hypothetical protein